MRGRRVRSLQSRAASLLTLVTLCLLPRPSAARELWSSGKSALELRAFLKTLGTGLRLPRGLVEATAILPESARLPLYGGLSASTARISGKLVLRERLEIEAGWQLAATIASSPMLVSGVALGGGVAVTSAQSAKRRLWDFDPVILQHDGLLIQHNLDLLAVKVRMKGLDVIAGRQVLSWGSGRLWNPTDLLSPFAPTDIDREVRRGVDALRLSVPLDATAQLELLWLPQLEWREQGAVLRAQANVRGFDVAPSVAKYVRDMVLGLDATGDVGPLGVHAELAWTVALDLDERQSREELLRSVAGLDYRPLEDLLLGVEYYFNGWGGTEPSDYLGVMRSGRVTRGEVFGAGRHYLGVMARWQATELLSIQGTIITNLADPSTIIVPALEYWAEQSVLIRAGAYLPAGRTPDPPVSRGLTGADPGLRSEYGSSAFGVFVQVGVYPL